MEWILNSILSHLVVVVLITLANNALMVAFAKLWNRRMERKNRIAELEAQVEGQQAMLTQLQSLLEQQTLKPTIKENALEQTSHD